MFTTIKKVLGYIKYFFSTIFNSITCKLCKLLYTGKRCEIKTRKYSKKHHHAVFKCMNANILLFAICFCIGFSCVTVVVAKSNEKKMQESYKVELSKQVAQVEADLISMYMADVVDYDYTQMTKSYLLEIQSNLLNCIEALEALEIHTSSNIQNIYAQLKTEYEECTNVLNNDLYLYPYSQEEYNLLAKIVMKEQGANVSTDEAQQGVAIVVLNRLQNNGINGDLENPTILDIVREPGQYGQYGNSMTWDVDTGNITDKVWENTRKVLEHEVEWPANILFQAPFTQGYGVYKACYNPEPYDNYTYFCYGRLSESNPYYEDYLDFDYENERP